MNQVWTQGIAVGFDGSQDGRRALDWAVRAAAVHACRLRVVYAYDVPISSAAPPLALTPRVRRESGERIVRSGLDHVACTAPKDLEVTGHVLPWLPSHVLVSLSKHNDLVVVGRRGLGKLNRLILGSTSAAVAARSAGPVAVVSRVSALRKTAKVVVGVDRADCSTALLTFAFEEALARHWPIELIHACRTPSSAVGDTDACDTLHRWAEKYPEVRASIDVREGDPLDMLSSRLRPWDVVVVGGRRRPRATGRMRGSVPGGLVRRAPCAVAIVHDSEVRSLGTD